MTSPVYKYYDFIPLGQFTQDWFMELISYYAIAPIFKSFLQVNYFGFSHCILPSYIRNWMYPMTNTRVQQVRAVSPGHFTRIPLIPVRNAKMPKRYPTVPSTMWIKWKTSRAGLDRRIVILASGRITTILIVVSNSDSPAQTPWANVYFSFEIW